MDSPLDDVAFLSNSENRVAVLRALADETLHRDELRDRIDASRVTLTRVLNDLESRRWIERTGQTCEATPLGEWVAEAFDDLLEVVRTEREFRRVMPWFPTEHVSFDVRRLRDADVVVPTPTNSAPHIQRAVDHLRSGRRARLLTFQTAPPIVEATATAVEERGQRFEGVLTPGLVRTVVNDPAMAPPFVEILDAPTADVYVCEEELYVIQFIVDDTVGIPLTDEEGVARALVLSDDEEVFEWAEETFERYRTRATPIGAASFPAR